MRMVGNVRNLLLWLTLMLLAAAGCGNDSESEPSRQHAVLRKKVSVSKEPAPQAVKPSGGAAVKPQTAKLPAKPGEEAQLPVEKAKEKIFESKAVTKPLLREAKVEPPSPEKERLVQPDESGVELLAEGIRKKSTYFYDRRGKLDPFKPLFAIEAERMARADKKAKKKKLPLTPLQRIDLSQLKLVGIIVSPTGNKALVEEPSGKGYIITKGTYVGTNFGRVKRILKDRVIVEEQVEDFFSGQMKLQTTQLRLQKDEVGDV